MDMTANKKSLMKAVDLLIPSNVDHDSIEARSLVPIMLYQYLVNGSQMETLFHALYQTLRTKLLLRRYL